MEKIIFGLVGKNISYSFSRGYFSEKFETLRLEAEYKNFDINHISEFPKIITPNLKGLNVTIPYKESVIPYLDELSQTAKAIGAVNTIELKNGRLIGHNTDYFGFQKSLEPLLQSHHKKALILGTGGASKAVAYALKNIGIDFAFVSRNADVNSISYESLDKSTFKEYQIIINTTPLGTFPNVDSAPDIPYELFTNQHIAYDLIYNPEETLFLKKAKSNGAITKNGLEMLQLQAEKSWEIWNGL
ncbi:MAG: shikimate dehydrogenase [Flavobacterium sp.]|nr:MAG: shikimate dehydrogenase [Flavobacterium sp.]